jgi:hypothetical protein
MSPEMSFTPGVECHTPTSASDFGYGSGLMRTLLTTLKIAVVPPIPSASVTTAIAVNPGAIRMRRSTYLSDPIEANTHQRVRRFARSAFNLRFPQIDRARFKSRAKPPCLAVCSTGVNYR